MHMHNIEIEIACREGRTSYGPSGTYICLFYSCSVDMAAASVPFTQRKDITECAICSEIFVDARVLPCTHTYCLQCITSLITTEKPAYKIPCPFCLKEFTIPKGGISELPKNYFVEKLLEAKSLTSILRHEDSLCDVCDDDDEEMSERKRKLNRNAIVYCIECRKNMCKQCYGCHQQFKLPGTHKLIERNKRPLATDDVLLKILETACVKHPEECLKVYCFDCKTVVCMMCYINEHSSHKCSDVKDVADDLATQMAANEEGIKAKIEDCKLMLKKIADEERTLSEEVTKTEKVVNENADKLKQLIDQHREEVLTKMTTAKTRQLKANENVKQELERQIVIMESFIRYSEELRQKGTACDIAKVAGKLRVKGEEFVNFDVEDDLPVDYTSTDVKFEATLSDDGMKRVFGVLDITVDVKGK